MVDPIAYKFIKIEDNKNIEALSYYDRNLFSFYSLELYGDTQKYGITKRKREDHSKYSRRNHSNSYQKGKMKTFWIVKF